MYQHYNCTCSWPCNGLEWCPDFLFPRSLVFPQAWLILFKDEFSSSLIVLQFSELLFETSYNTCSFASLQSWVWIEAFCFEIAHSYKIMCTTVLIIFPLHTHMLTHTHTHTPMHTHTWGGEGYWQPLWRTSGSLWSGLSEELALQGMLWWVAAC